MTKHRKNQGKKIAVRMPWRLKIGRDNLPGLIQKVESSFDSKEAIEWLEWSRDWLKNRSSGFNGRIALSREEVKIRKKELGEILFQYNKEFSNGSPFKY